MLLPMQSQPLAVGSMQQNRKVRVLVMVTWQSAAAGMNDLGQTDSTMSTLASHITEVTSVLKLVCDADLLDSGAVMLQTPNDTPIMTLPSRSPHTPCSLPSLARHHGRNSVPQRGVRGRYRS